MTAAVSQVNNHIEIGKAGTNPVFIDVPRLTETRVLINASSGAGKSWTLRRLLEQTYGSVQHFVIDPEGEFRTLREKFDYVLVGHEGDIPAKPSTAATLARRLLELGASAILDIAELHMDERRAFVQQFVDSMMNAPKHLWHPVMVVIDEAHMFAPETGKSEALLSVIDLMARGRKRGFCGVLATQRISKLHKDAVAEALNVLIGRTSLDIDVERALRTLGYRGREAEQEIRTLPDGHFYTFGPAIAPVPVEITVGPVQTRHPKAGERSLPPAAPRETVRAMLDNLRDLDEQATLEVTDLESAKARIAELEAQLEDIGDGQAVYTIEEMQAAERRGVAKGRRLALDAVSGHMRDLSRYIDASQTELKRELAEVAEVIADPEIVDDDESGELADFPYHPVDGRIALVDLVPARPLPPKPADNTRAGRGPESAKRETTGPPKLGKCEKALLAVLASRGGRSTTRAQISILSGYSSNSSSFANALGALRSAGLITGSGDQNTITDLGMSAIGSDYDVMPPRGRDLAKTWMQKLEKCERAILTVLLQHRDGVDIEKLSTLSGYSRTSSSFANAIGRLRTLELAHAGWPLRAAKELF